MYVFPPCAGFSGPTRLVRPGDELIFSSTYNPSDWSSDTRPLSKDQDHWLASMYPAGKVTPAPHTFKEPLTGDALSAMRPCARYVYYGKCTGTGGVTSTVLAWNFIIVVSRMQHRSWSWEGGSSISKWQLGDIFYCFWPHKGPWSWVWHHGVWALPCWFSTWYPQCTLRISYHQGPSWRYELEVEWNVFLVSLKGNTLSNGKHNGIEELVREFVTVHFFNIHDESA